MRVLFDHPFPFALTHGGFQIQIEQTAAALRAIGVDVEFIRWWDDTQRGDIIHYFGRPTEIYVRLAHEKGMKVVVADLLTELGSRPRLVRAAQKAVTELTRLALPRSFTARMGWEAFVLADAVVALTPWEGRLVQEMFGTPEARIHVVPNGVEEPFFAAEPAERGPWLVCTATITQRKRVLELAQAAVVAQAPTWIIGKPYGATDVYFLELDRLARAEPRWVRYEGAITDRIRLAQVYRAARGFVLLSTMESLSLSALEAAACECPLLLSDLPWARTVFGSRASYCPVADTSRTAAVLKSFYDQAAELPRPPRPIKWVEVAGQLRSLYERLSTSR